MTILSKAASSLEQIMITGCLPFIPPDIFTPIRQAYTGGGMVKSLQQIRTMNLCSHRSLLIELLQYSTATSGYIFKLLSSILAGITWQLLRIIFIVGTVLRSIM